MNFKIYVSYNILFTQPFSSYVFSFFIVAMMMKDDVSTVEMLKSNAKTIGGVLGAE